MTIPVINTKLFIPQPRTDMVARPRLLKRLDESIHCKLTVISASAGSGKTTLLSAWIAQCNQPVAWLSLDAADAEPVRFLTYLIAAIQTIKPDFGSDLLGTLQSPQLPTMESILADLLNELATLHKDFLLILDDYHVIDSEPVDRIIFFLVQHLPPQMHLILASREDPPLPLARLRAEGQLIELRLNDLRFTHDETANFLNHVMALNLSEEDVTSLALHTEGWITGLQLAAISMQGQDTAAFVQSFTGSHRFILDYLVEEVLQNQSEAIQSFLLQTSIFERMCRPLCEMVLQLPSDTVQDILKYLEHANLFVIPLDHERRWYRYHHLFADLLRQRLGQILAVEEINLLHIRASHWYEEQGMFPEALIHATKAEDIPLGIHLINQKAMPLYDRSVSQMILAWLADLPEETKNKNPALWVMSGTIALITGQTAGVEEQLQTAEQAIKQEDKDILNKPPYQLETTLRSLLGKIACARATLALTHYDPSSMIIEAKRAIRYLPEEEAAFRFVANWALTSASMLEGDRSTAAQACQECLQLSRQSGDVFSIILAETNLAEIQEQQNQLRQAYETNQHILQLSGDYPSPNIGEVHLSLARIEYAWNHLDAAEEHAQVSLKLSSQFDSVIDRHIMSEVFLAHLLLARGKSEAAFSMLLQTEQTARSKRFLLRLPEIANMQILTLVHQGNLAAAARLSEQYELPLCKARVYLAQGNQNGALSILNPLYFEAQAKGWQDEYLKVKILLAIAYQQHQETKQALDLLDEALSIAEPEGFIRLFLDEGNTMRVLLSEYQSQSIKGSIVTSPVKTAYVKNILSQFPMKNNSTQQAGIHELLSQREIEILELIAQGLSNQDIAGRLFIALDTVKGHNRRIFEKLNVQRRTEAIVRARETGIL